MKNKIQNTKTEGQSTATPPFYGFIIQSRSIPAETTGEGRLVAVLSPNWP